MGDCKPRNEIKCEPGTYPISCPDDNKLYTCDTCPSGTFSSRVTMLGDKCEMRLECTEDMVELPVSVDSKIMDAECRCMGNSEMNIPLHKCIPTGGFETTAESLPSPGSSDPMNAEHIMLIIFGLIIFILAITIVIIIVYYKRKIQKLKQGYSNVEQAIPLDDTDASSVISEANRNKEFNDAGLKVAKTFLRNEVEKDMFPELTRELLQERNAIDYIQLKAKDDFREQITQMLNEWENYKGHEAKIGVLYNALCKIGAKKLGQDMCLKIQSDMQGNVAAQLHDTTELSSNGAAQSNGSSRHLSNGATPSSD